MFYIVCYFPWLQFWRQVYLLTVLSLILAVFSAQVHPRYLSNDWRWIRMSIFCCVAGVGTIPACHWVWLNGGFTSDVVQVRKQSLCAVCSLYRFRALLQAVSAGFNPEMRIFPVYHKSFLSLFQLFLPRVIIMYLIAGSAFLFYVTKIPERYFPGEFCLSAAAFVSVCFWLYRVNDFDINFSSMHSPIQIIVFRRSNHFYCHRCIKASA